MDTKKKLRKILFTSVAVVLGAGMLTLLVAAIGEKRKGQCSDYKITIKSVHDNLFIDEKEVFRILAAATHGNLKGQSIASINLRSLETLLKGNNWVRDAQLYFDNNDVLHVSVTEREPLARLFTTAGNSFYIDSAAKRMPLSEKHPARVPVFTGFPEKKILSAADSLLLVNVKIFASFINSHPFWLAQAAEIDITEDRNFEMIPLVGNHLVKFGDATDLEQKFHRLYLFYQSVLSKTGFDKYRIIDAQYRGQIVAIRKGEKMNAVDTARLKLNVQKLLKQALEEQNDTMVNARPVALNTSSREISVDAIEKADQAGNEKASDPHPLKLSVKTNPVKKPVPPNKQKTKPQAAKALMKKKV